MVFWDVMPRTGFQMHQVPLKCSHMSTKLQDVRSQKIVSSYFPQQEPQSHIFKASQGKIIQNEWH